jgi:hypothetical protein
MTCFRYWALLEASNEPGRSWRFRGCIATGLPRSSSGQYWPNYTNARA